MLELVAQRGQVRDVGRDLTNDVAQPLVNVSSRGFATFRPNSTHRTAGHAEAAKQQGDIRAGRAPSPKASPQSGRRRRRRSPWNLWSHEFLGDRG
eukprot:6197332-Pleurochrysis_carterae.AAC.3